MTITRERPSTPLGREEDRALRPSSLEDFIGQEALKDKLRVAIEAAKTRKEALDPHSFFWPTGFLAKPAYLLLWQRKWEAPSTVPALLLSRALRTLLAFLPF